MPNPAFVCQCDMVAIYLAGLVHDRSNRGRGGSCNLKIVGMQVEDRMNVGMHQEVGADDALIVTIIVKDNALDHMFSKGGLHGYNNWTLKQLLVKSTFDEAKGQHRALGVGVNQGVCIDAANFDGYLKGSCRGIFSNKHLHGWR
uniref:Uncharacterized protein n=1 Tax=Romanomermis culicivorax TaxID=13658 RepID=A0A915HHS6_ROMCU